MPESAILLKMRLWHRCFPVNFGKFLRTSFLTEHLRWLLLYNDKEEIRMLNDEIEMLKEENRKLEYNINEKEPLIKSLKR